MIQMHLRGWRGWRDRLLGLMSGCAVVVLAATSAAVAVEPVTVEVVSDGRAALPVVVAPDAAEQSRIAAEELADYLERISGVAFELREGEGADGLVVGAVDEWPGLELDEVFEPDDPFRREEYLLRSDEQGIKLIGATPAAARLAVWDLLHRLGHRQFFPGERWEVIPSHDEIDIAVDVIDGPDYPLRRIYPGGSRWAFSEEPLDQWRMRNRNHSEASFQLRTSHAYGAILRARRDVFDANPEFYALVDGERAHLGGNTKFCIANPALRELVVNHAVERLEANPDQESISMDPSDGGNWCECDDCAALGSISDRVVVLANDVAEAINELGLGDKYVGIYAYNQHSPPPSIDVHPRVVVSVATSFIRGGYTANDLVEQWSARGATIGIREYYSISTWHGDRPGRARAANLPYLKRTIPHFHAHGARFNIANISHSWGAYGLGFYLMAHLFWDVDNAERVDELIDDFLTRAFGPAREPMEAFYRLIYRHSEDEGAPLLSEHLIGSMYRHLDEALRLAHDDQDVIDRIKDLVLYTHYVDLYHQTSTAAGSQRQALGEALLRHIHAMRRTMFVVSHRGDPRRLPSFDMPEGDALDAVRSVDAYTPEQIRQMLAEGIAENELLDFEPVGFSDELVPAAEPLGLPDVSRGSLGTHAPRHTRSFYTWRDEPGPITLRVRGGMISHYRDRGNVRLTLHSPLDVLGDGVDFDDSVPPDGEEHTATLTTPHAGLHRIEVSDGGDSTFVFIEDDRLPYTVPVDLGDAFTYRGRWSLYFYVPKGTEVIGGFAANTAGQVVDGSGNVVFEFDELEGPGHFSFAVPEGRDGQLWKFERCRGPRYLMTVPPYLARSAEELLLPREVVEADAQQ